MNRPLRYPFIVLALLIGASLSFAQASREVKKTVPLDVDGRVSIDTYKGSITVTTWDKKEVEIAAVIEADESGWDSRRDEEEKVQDTEIEIDGSGREVHIKSDYDKLKRRHSGFWGMFDGDTGSLPLVHYTIKMPATANLKVKDYKSESNITDVKGDIAFNTYKGEVSITGVEGKMDFETYKGDVRIAFTAFKKSNRFETYKGEIEIVLPRNTAFELDADMGKKGDLRSDFDVSESRSRYDRKRTGLYRGDINGGGPRLTLETYKGTYRLREG
ncbi:MAG: DUF4097 domain-containing protein [Nitrososphaera sp.]|nr:DUF4097 domain-containing protein [Nitrososphaera sp.]MCI0706192.1 DUF4097 domain-containing protein [Ignavibacteriota bacterium]